MGKKHFQDFANVLCQKFVECTTNVDLVDLAIFGDGCLELFITEGRATHEGHAVQPLPFAAEWLAWVEWRLDALGIPRGELQSALLRVNYTVELTRASSLKWLGCKFAFDCTGIITSGDREYRAERRAEIRRGLSQVSPWRRQTDKGSAQSAEVDT